MTSTSQPADTQPVSGSASSMTVSAVVPTYNRRRYIRRALNSILAQTVAVHEIIVVDDGSSDGTADAVEAWYGPKVRVVRQQNGGVSAARKRGIEEARGEWIAFLDSDDVWVAEHNEHLLRAAAAAPKDVAWVFGDLRVVTDAGEGKTLFEDYGLSVNESPHVFADSLSVQFPFQFGMLQASLIRRSALLELRCFSVNLRSDDDLLAGFQVACRYRFAAIPSVVGKYIRTSDLDASSVVVNGVNGVDYYRSRMLAFESVVHTGRRHPWNHRYAEAVRGLCKALASKGQPSRTLALQQFRFGGYSAKAVGFLFAALLGIPGMHAWNKAASLRRKVLRVT
jgi:glycosyltransferase involved in cell wall biosynthesis